jgi:hypothetical protein
MLKDDPNMAYSQKEESIMRRVCSISVKEILSMERSFPAFLLLINTITELAENEASDSVAKGSEATVPAVARELS